ncbi:polyamine-transporting ATPase 13A3 isoform X1 [Megachile rotundata]|uniref:polyamine-transporting ATPase 13A3 isoform X1 n=2 Tax=Megachile rotundata TaxID=143995 RepID=UPI000614B9D5|nr:PREDICTED: probable cation-transporting ATPase 13A3 isoform X1 [Megachile rotundata]XP_012152490.1 PREDICTED: probable cation-transporting ATPase 13A3 isoform X1 [Megachile rotundata]
MTTTNGLKNDQSSEVLWQKIHTGQDEDMRVYGFEKNKFKSVLVYVSYVLTAGWVRLFFHWYPQLHLYATHDKCPLSRATKLLVTDNYQGKYKSYFVKEVKTISTRNISAQQLSRDLNTNDEQLVEKIRCKRLKINLENGTQCEVFEYKAFWCKKQCYVWDITQNAFSRLIGLDKYTLCSDLHLNSNQGLSKEEQCLRRIVYGNNEIIVPVQSIGVLLILEVLNPFYIFQVFTLCVWFAEGYLYYTVAIVCMSFFGITSSIIQTRKNQINLRGTVASTETVRVHRSKKISENISSSELVPGDIIELPKHQATVICDAVLLTGQCILNESMLTGESVPVTKTPLPSRHVLYDSKECSHHTIFSGTTIIQTRSYSDSPVLARVIRTGYHTSKGSLVAAILYPPPADFKFDQDSYKFIGILAVIATCGFLYTIVTKASRGITADDIAIKALDIITIVIPPALPAAMTVGKLYAQARLKRAEIYCINNRVINVSGGINCVCFDKTGTLTEDGLDMWGIVPCTDGLLGESERTVPKLSGHPLFEGMLVCHSLTLIDGELCGDPLDVKMFESTGWILEESEPEHLNEHDLVTPTIAKPGKNKNGVAENANEIFEIGIVQQYQFSSSLQRMSVIVRVLGSEIFRAYTKGSPEMILSLSKPETIPKDIMFCLKRYTEQGYRVIAMGRKELSESNAKIVKLPRDAIEQNLEFLGLVVMENRLKLPTIPVIQELRAADMHVLMITGDNIQTAVSVAKECGILSSQESVIDVTVVMEEDKSQPKIYFNAQQLSPKLSLRDKRIKIPELHDIERNIGSRNYRFALTGQSWQLLREHYPDIVAKICVRGAIFARMTSDQKQQLVLELMQLGYYVAMCGDGANDCGALRAAHTGISLSEAESSVASPFTSKVPDITCVPKVMKEGRAALVTSFGIFKFMVTYSLTEFVSVIILYSIDSNLTDLEFLFIDICLIVNFASFFGKTRAYEKKLVKKPPMTSLLSFTTIFSLTVHMLIMTIFQAVAYHAVRSFPWFTPFVHANNAEDACYENYSVYCVSMFQYITMAIIFSRGKPYRKPVYSNIAFVFSIILMTIVCAYITVYPAHWIINTLKLRLPPSYHWSIIILALALANFLTCLFVETFIIEYIIEKKFRSRFYRPEKSKKEYFKVEYQLKNDFGWPPLSNELPILPLTPSIENIMNVKYPEEQSKNDFNDKVERNKENNGLYAFDNYTFEDDELTKNTNMITRF